MKKISKLFCMVFSLVLLCTILVGCNSSTSNDNSEKLSYISMRINPEIELVVNENGVVVAVNAINEDGETVLCELDLIGLTAEEAGEMFTSMAIELGFIDVDAENTTVYICTSGENDDFANELEEKMTEKINKFFDKKGIFGKATPEELEEFISLAEEWGVSLKDAMMINRILELYPEMTLEEILALTFEERIKLIKNDSEKNGLPANLREEYKEEIISLKEEYNELFILGKELKELEIRLTNPNLSEEERILLQEEYDVKKAEYEILKAEFEAAVEAIKNEKLDKVEEAKKELMDKAKNRREEFAEKVKEHEEKVSEIKEELEEQIKNWRENNK